MSPGPGVPVYVVEFATEVGRVGVHDGSFIG
jgi:hypothetical protein